MNRDRAGTYFFVLFLVIIVLGALLARDELARGREPAIGQVSSQAQQTPQPVTMMDVRSVAESAITEYPLAAEIPNERVPQDIRARLGVKETIVLLVYGKVKVG